MSVAEVILRADLILKKYEKYDPNNQHVPREKSDDAFMDEYLAIMDQIQDMTLKSEEIAQERNRALKAALNADLRKAKAALVETAVPKLEALARSTKGVLPEVVRERAQKIEEVRAAIEDISDGVHAGVKKPQRAFSQGAGGSRLGGEVTINTLQMDGRYGSADYYKHTDATQAFQTEAEQAKQRQDQQLSRIETGLGTLREIGEAMGEELNRHDLLVDEVNAKMDSVTKQLANNNMRLKGIVTKVRTTRNFFIDLILICILLAVGLYLYNMFK